MHSDKPSGQAAKLDSLSPPPGPTAGPTAGPEAGPTAGPTARTGNGPAPIVLTAAGGPRLKGAFAVIRELMEDFLRVRGPAGVLDPEQHRLLLPMTLLIPGLTYRLGLAGPSPIAAHRPHLDPETIFPAARAWLAALMDQPDHFLVEVSAPDPESRLLLGHVEPRSRVSIVPGV